MPPDALLHCARNAAVAGVRGPCANGSYRPGHSPPCSFQCRDSPCDSRSRGERKLTEQGACRSRAMLRWPRSGTPVDRVTEAMLPESVRDGSKRSARARSVRSSMRDAGREGGVAAFAEPPGPCMPCSSLVSSIASKSASGCFAPRARGVQCLGHLSVANRQDQRPTLPDRLGKGGPAPAWLHSPHLTSPHPTLRSPRGEPGRASRNPPPSRSRP